jgi:predicted alpha/beta-hydrolase family hydrolase
MDSGARMVTMDVLLDGPEAPEATFLFAHGAGGAMDTPFMASVARALGERSIRVVRFEFPYMAARRHGGKRGAPDRPPVLLDAFREVIRAHRGAGRMVIGGKSMGGRIATMVADEMDVDGVVCFGYPFHPPGKPQQLRTAHLATIRSPVLVLQGERDPFGTREEVGGYPLSPAIRVEWLPDGDHSLVPRKASGVTAAENLARAVELAARFILGGGHS